MVPSTVLIQCLLERIDVERNVPGYQGLTPLDYPGDNDEYEL